MTKNEAPLRFGDYEVKGRLGYGGYGTIYHAYDSDLGREVVLKVLHHHLVAEEDMVKRFMREARAMAFFKHPNIVGVYSFEKASPRPYIVMEYVDGINLETYLDDNALLLSDAIPILQQTAEGIDAAHAHEMVHRDIKPSNILITKDGRVKVTDFGIVKRTQSAETTLTDPSIVLGTVWYMAPEQADINRQHEVGPSVDIYALGVVAYQMLVGRVPFDSRSKDVIMAAHRTQPPPHPRVFGVDLPPSVVRVLMKVLAKQPADRYPTARAFANALQKAVSTSSTEIDILPDPSDQPAPKAGSRQIHKSTSTGIKQLSKSVQLPYQPALTMLLVLLLLCLGGNALYLASLDQTPPPTQIADAVVQAPLINLREGPGEEFRELASFPKGTILQVIGRESQGIWLQVESPDGERGWVFAGLLTVDRELEEIAFVLSPTIISLSPTGSSLAGPQITQGASNTVVPSNETAPAASGTAIGQTQTALPATESAVPSNEAAQPTSDTATGESQSALPATESAVPSNETAQPTSDTATGESESGLPATESAVPSNETAQAASGTAIGESDSASPAAENAVASNETGQPASGTAIEQSDTALPAAEKGVSSNQTQPASETLISATTTPVPATNTILLTSITPVPASDTVIPVSLTAVPTSQKRPPVSLTAVPTSQKRPPVSLTAVPTSQKRPPVSLTAVPASQKRPPVSLTA
ncbi:MAG: protein kinase domain-containing protein, partial [Ardenticatenaceae bacterium]